MESIAYDTAEDWEGDGEHTDTQVMGSRVTGYLAYGCAFLFLCLIVFLRKQIALANGIIKVVYVVVLCTLLWNGEREHASI